MATNNEGMGGSVIEHIAVEKVTLIGMQSPNEFPSTRESQDRVVLPKMNLSGNKGCEITDVPVYDCEPIDTSWLSYGGRYTLGVGNKWHIRVGGGGIYTETLGPITTDGEVITTNAKKGFFIQAKLFQMIADERAMISGKRLDFNFDEIVVQGKTTFVNNVVINGGLYVNGEFMSTHQTGGKQLGTTGFNEETLSYISPAASFHIFQGASKTAMKYTQKSLLGTLFDFLDVTDADEQQSWIEAEMCINTDFISQILPGLDKVGLDVIKMILCLPIKLKFPKGISLISDATDEQCPLIYPLIELTPRTLGCGKEVPDTFGPGHTHPYYGPSCNYISDTTGIYKAAQDFDQLEPIKHKANVFGGAESIDKAKEEVTKMAQDYASKYGKKLLKMMNPFEAGLPDAAPTGGA